MPMANCYYMVKNLNLSVVESQIGQGLKNNGQRLDQKLRFDTNNKTKFITKYMSNVNNTDNL